MDNTSRLRRRVKELETILKMRFTAVRKEDVLLIQGLPTTKDLQILEMVGEKTGVSYVICEGLTCENLTMALAYMDDELLKTMGLKRIGVEGGNDLH